ncbi:hypothetical protein DFQ26_008970 [Actinomortierella ambigua]|nr:hypothetical protein DFQ26_008970 [Actinomortierella ambigua]
MKPQTGLKSRHRNINNVAPATAGSGNEVAGTSAAGGAPARVPRMLRRMTRQSFMDIDLQYLLKHDPGANNPFGNASDVLSDPPSLFRPLPQVAAVAQAIAQGVAGPWQFREVERLQKEQEELRVQYLQFLHQLHAANPHAYLAHMNAFAAEAPQEFLQLQSYIKYQEDKLNAERAEAQRQEEMRQYQLEVERRLKHEQDLKKFQEFQETQERQRQELEQQHLLADWLIRRQQQRALMRKAPDLADLFTLAFQQDNALLGKVVSNPAGIEMVLTPQQQHEFAQHLHQVHQRTYTPFGTFGTQQQQQQQQQPQQQQPFVQSLFPTQSAFTPASNSGASSSPFTFSPTANYTHLFANALIQQDRARSRSSQRRR